MKKSKNWCITILIAVLVTVILFGTTTCVLDPLLQYRKESDIFTYWQSSEIYSNPGIAKNYDYDAVLVGSSMVENTDIYECNDLLNCNMIKVPYSGGSSFNHKTILDICFKSNKSIKNVYWALDEYALTTDYMTPRYPLPEYLYDFDTNNDLSYLLNLDVFYFYTIKNITNSLKGQEQKAMRGGSWIDDDSEYNKNNMLASFVFPMEQKKINGEKYYEKNLNQNMEYNIIPVIKENSNTTFNFYMVPYSIAYWYQEKCNGNLEAHFYDIKCALREILNYDNARVYFYQDNKDIILTLDNYKDYTHFKPEINSYMTKQMSKGLGKINKDNYEKVLDDFYLYLKTFDYDSFFKKEMNK